MAENKVFKSMDGNEAAAYAAYAFTESAAIYPITPSSPMADHTDQWAARGKKNIFGRPVKLVEMERIKEYSWCCGAGAHMDTLDKGLSDWTASERITEANATGADALVTACPWCESNFAGAKDENGETIKVLDIIDLVSQAL